MPLKPSCNGDTPGSAFSSGFWTRLDFSTQIMLMEKGQSAEGGRMGPVGWKSLRAGAEADALGVPGVLTACFWGRA